MTSTPDLPGFPMPRACPFDPNPRYARLREDRPVTEVALPNDRTGWLVTRHDLARQVLGEPRTSSNWLHPNFPFPIEIPPEALAATVTFSRALISADPPEHTERRRMLAAEFTVRRVRELAPRIREIVEERVDDLLTGPKPADLVRALALPVPSLVICELLGVPYADRELFQDRTRVLADPRVAPDERAEASAGLAGYLDELVAAKERDPGDDLLGRLIRRSAGTGVFDHGLLTDTAMVLLIAGHETTANMISLGIAALLGHPDQLAALRAEPARMPAAVDELLRYLTIIEAQMRVATADLDVGGVPVKAGDGLIAEVHAANRDERAFPHADALDLARPERHHLAFGHGIHQCLGHNLARLELETVFSTVLRRIPGLRLATPPAELPFKEDANMYGLRELPVTW
jgi:cytochrome P450